MWLWQWWRWCLGYVTFRAEGGLCERFLNLLSDNAAPVKLWDVSREEGAVTAACRVSEYARVRPFARRTGTRVRAIKKSGAFLYVRPLMRRPGLIVGAALALCVYMLLASHIWVVSIDVEDPALVDRIEQQLEDSGVSIGKPMASVDVAAVRMAAIAGVEEIHQLSLYFDGSIARVEVQLQEEGVKPPDTSPANIVADTDGRIIAMQTTAGQAMVKVGEAVVKGDLLVCGAVETATGVLLRHASAVVIAETTHTFEETVALQELLPQSGQVIEQPTLHVFTWALPLYSPAAFDETWTVTQEERFVTLFDTTLPVGITTEVYTEQCMQTVTHTKEDAERLAKERLQAKALTALSEATVKEVSFEGRWEGEIYYLRAVYECEENIAAEVPLHVLE